MKKKKETILSAISYPQTTFTPITLTTIDLISVFKAEELKKIFKTYIAGLQPYLCTPAQGPTLTNMQILQQSV